MDFPGISLDLANKFYTLGWRVSIFTAIITLAGVLLLYLGTRVKDRDSEQQQIISRERIASLELEAEKRRADNISLQTSLEREKIARLKLEAHIAPRRLSPTEKKAIVEAIKPFAGQRVRISSILGETEGKEYANDFVNALETAGWNLSGDSAVNYVQRDSDPVGIELYVHQVTARQGENIPALQALFKVLKDLSLIGEPGVKMNRQVPSGEIELSIGCKPPRE